MKKVALTIFKLYQIKVIRWQVRNIHTNNLDNNELIQIPAAKPKKNIMNKLRTKIASIPCKPKIALYCCGFVLEVLNILTSQLKII